MTSPADLAHLDADQLRTLAARLMGEMQAKQATIDKLTHEMATLKRIKFAATREAYTGEQQRLLFETIEADLEALQVELDRKRSMMDAPCGAVGRVVSAITSG